MAVTLIKKKQLNLKPLQAGMVGVLKKQGRINEKRLNQPTKTFNTVDPSIKSEVDKKDYSVITAPIDNDDGNKYKFLDKGTSVRYAIMSEDFIAKTIPNSFISGVGQGGLAFIDVNNPQPGIEARNWSKLTAEEELPNFEKNTNNALQKGLNRLY